VVLVAPLGVESAVVLVSSLGVESAVVSASRSAKDISEDSYNDNQILKKAVKMYF